MYRNKSWPLSRTALVVCLLCVVAAAWGQQTSAQLSGVVKDAQGAVIPGAKVVVINEAQRAVVREFRTEADGSFVIFP